MLQPDDITTCEQLAAKLLERLEEVLRDEFSSDGDDVTGFARGWLGMPLPDNPNEVPHRLHSDWLAGVEARNQRPSAGQAGPSP